MTAISTSLFLWVSALRAMWSCFTVHRVVGLLVHYYSLLLSTLLTVLRNLKFHRLVLSTKSSRGGGLVNTSLLGDLTVNSIWMRCIPTEQTCCLIPGPWSTFDTSSLLWKGYIRILDDKPFGLYFLTIIRRYNCSVVELTVVGTSHPLALTQQCSS